MAGFDFGGFAGLAVDDAGDAFFDVEEGEFGVVLEC